jgi:hypothetical protein
MTTITTTAALAAALTAAQGGETFTLPPGPLDSLGLRHVEPASTVVIASADPANPAVIAGMEFDSCQHLTFSDIEVRLNARTQTVCDVAYSSGIRFQRVDFADAPGSSNAGLLFKNSSSVSVDTCNFHDSGTFVRNVNSDHVTISNSIFHDGQGDGIQSNGSSFVTLLGNRFTDFNPSGGDHPDAMQFFTYGQTAPATDILVQDNVVTRGKGGIVQGVFMGNEAHIPYERVKILGNGLAGTMYNGIAINAASDVEISHNYVLPYVDMGSSIGAGPVTGLVMDGNCTAGPIDTAGSSGVSVSNTQTIQPAAVGDDSALKAWLAARASAQVPSTTAPDPLGNQGETLAAQVADLTARLSQATAAAGDLQGRVSQALADAKTARAQAAALQAKIDKARQALA